jgi:hypothetical protein
MPGWPNLTRYNQAIGGGGHVPLPFTGAGGGPQFVAASLRLDVLSTIVRDVHLGENGFALVSRAGC